MRFISLAIIFWSFVAIPAQNPCPEVASEWKEDEAKRLLSESPWSKKTTYVELAQWSALDEERGPMSQLYRRGYGADKGSGAHGEKEVEYTYTSRLYSALPVRQAFAQLAEAQRRDSNTSAAEKLTLSDKISKLLSADTSEVIAVSLDVKSNDPATEMDVRRRLGELNTETWRSGTQTRPRQVPDQRANLISDRLGRVELKAYYRPSGDGTGAKFVFPRVINNQPVVLPTDKELKLELIMPGTGHKVYVVWKVKDMICGGHLFL